MINGFKGVLHRSDGATYSDLTAKLRLQPGTSRKMVSVCMGFDDPLQLKLVCLNVVYKFLCGFGAGFSGMRFVIKNGVNDGALRINRNMYNIRECGGMRIKKRFCVQSLHI